MLTLNAPPARRQQPRLDLEHWPIAHSVTEERMRDLRIDPLLVPLQEPLSPAVDMPPAARRPPGRGSRQVVTSTTRRPGQMIVTEARGDAANADDLSDLFKPGAIFHGTIH